MTDRVKLTDPATGQDYRAGGNLDASGNTVTVAGPLSAGADRSGSAGTTSATLAPVNANRRGLNVQNVGTGNLGINEFGGAAAIGTAGTYTLPAGAALNVRTNRQVTVIAATANTPYTATEF